MPDVRPDDPTRPDAAPAGLSRRSFLRTSALTAGAAALPLSAASAAAAQSAPGDTANTCPTPVGTDHWVQPETWCVGLHGDTPLQLTVSEIAAPAWLRVNAAAGGTTTTPKGPATLFTYNGKIPGPTVRMRGNDVLRVQLVNALSGNDSNWAHRNSSRFAKAARVGYTDIAANEVVPNVPDWQLSGNLIYGPHMQHTTNLHTHGLHVRPGMNRNGTHSDNVMLRVIPYEDAANRALATPPIPLSTHNPDDRQHVEVAGQASYEFQLGASAGVGAPTHPPGTHWYHPHPHGATYDQVVSGMAGFLIVEGDVDDAINEAMTGDPRPAPDTPTGDWDYRERLFLLQRVFDTGTAPIADEEALGALANRKNKQQGHVNTVNGQQAGCLAFEMRAGAVERWRVLNGSVDGRGFVRFCVVPEGLTPPRAPSQPSKGSLSNRDYNEALAAFSRQIAAWDRQLAAWAAEHGAELWHLAFDGVTLVERGRDGDEPRYRTRPLTSLELAPANRSDFLFQAPDEAGTYEVWGLGLTERAGDPAQGPMLVATVTVTARAEPPPRLAAEFFDEVLAGVPVPEELRPVRAREAGLGGGRVRSRRLVYSGWGGSYSAGCISQKAIDDGNGTNSMVISRLKYDPDRPVQKMGLGTAEEWVLDNYSVGHPESNNGAVAHPFHMHQNPFWVLGIFDPIWEPVLDADGDPVFDDENNPRYRFGGYRNRLDAPRWQDVVPIPVNGGRVVFRSRFPDFDGFYVNHCHLLQHEDWGMMQAVEVMADPDDANFAAEPPYDPREPGAVYPLPTVSRMREYCRTFFDVDKDRQIGRGGVVTDGTPVNFCVPGPPPSS